jgi:hypothetical protein
LTLANILLSNRHVARHTPKHKQKRLSIRKAADMLGVDFGHLARVLKHERVSRSLMLRYRELRRNGGGGTLVAK